MIYTRCKYVRLGITMETPDHAVHQMRFMTTYHVMEYTLTNTGRADDTDEVIFPQ